MADLLLNIIVEGVLSKAFSLANEKISLIWCVTEHLKKLAQDLEMIQALLADAEKKNTSSNTAVRLWLRRLQNVASKADNVLDEFSYEALAEKIQQRKLDKVFRFFSHSNPMLFRSRMARKIKNITSSLDEIFQGAHRIGLIPVQTAAPSFAIPTNERLSTDPFVDDSEIVGRTDYAEEIVRTLISFEGEKRLFLVGITGMPGVGKTTLAQLVYNDEKVGKYFDHKIWIHVSDSFNVERLLNEMLQSLTRTVSKLTNKETIVRGLQDSLRAKRFLLLLDDVWNEDEELWNTMKRCLLEIGASTGSRIVVTTRKESVVSTMQASFMCRLGILSEDHSQELFEKIAFGPGGAIKSPELENIGRQIVKKCGGVPLAIKAIGRLMYSRKEEQGWSKIEKSDVWNMFDADGNEVKSAIKLSYDNLPSLSLKHCFAYCSLYWKGRVMGLESMIQVWMAQGLLNLSMKDQGTMEDIGFKYMNILLQSSLLECVKRDEYGNNIYCKMHDLMHDFASEVAKDCSLFGSAELLTEKNEVPKKILKQTFSDQRTLILNDYLEVALSHCGDLRILIVDDRSQQELPKSIEKLKHLRYLDITKTSITKLPNCISNLYHLQTLRLPSLQEVPKNFSHLASLRHLYIQEEGTSKDKHCLLPGIRVLTSLQTLPFFCVSPDGQCQISELGPLNHIKGNLKIFGLQNVMSLEEARKAKISTKVNLESLELQWDVIERINDFNDEDVLKGLEPHSNLKGLKIENYKGQNLPPWMMVTSRPTILRNLVKVILKSFINCENVPPLGHLMHLKIINFEGMCSIKSIGRDFYGWTNLDDANNPSDVAGASVVIFPALEELILKDMGNLKEWSGFFEHGLSHPAVKILPSLVKFEIENCTELVSLPDDIWKDLSSIRELSILGCHSLSHLPEVVGQLASLEVLKVVSCPNLEYIPDIHRLKCMSELSISACRQLHSLPKGIEACTSIEKLSIVDCPNVQLGDSCQLPIIGLQIAGMRSLPEQIQHLSALTVLSILKCNDIQCLPEWLGSIASLQMLHIKSCEKLLYLPSAGAMQCLINLRELRIQNCPLLKERCNRDSGPEWHKIAHIATVEICD